MQGRVVFAPCFLLPLNLAYGIIFLLHEAPASLNAMFLEILSIFLIIFECLYFTL